MSSAGTGAVSSTTGGSTQELGSGGTPAGSTSGTGGSGGVPTGCYNPGPGFCCYEDEFCVDPGTAWSTLTQPPGGGIGGAGGAAFTSVECPDKSDLYRGLCYGHQPTTHRDGLCCYVPWSGSCCGRPFVVDGEARVARAARRRDWCEAQVSSTGTLDERTQTELASEWLADALLEHASVASFARFVLDLLAVGAPAALVERAQAAIGDEIAHARLCFALASRYAGKELGPGVLPTSEAGRSTRLADLAAAAVREGCVGETLAALQAEAQLARAVDSQCREALEVIARDEANHAELSWAFVRWAVERGGESVRSAVRAAFAEAERKLAGDGDETPAVDREQFAVHGRLLPEERRACHRAGFREVIRPCRHALLGEN